MNDYDSVFITQAVNPEFIFLHQGPTIRIIVIQKRHIKMNYHNDNMYSELTKKTVFFYNTKTVRETLETELHHKVESNA